MELYIPNQFAGIRVGVNTVMLDTELYYSIISCLVNGEFLSELKQWRASLNDFVRISIFFLGFTLNEYRLASHFVKPISYMKMLHKYLIGEINKNQLSLLSEELIKE